MIPVRIGLAGYGRGGRFFHAPLIGLAPECALAGVLTRSPRRRAELADDFPGLPAAGSLAELAAAGIDAVVISTPLDTHEALVREAIALGLPVVCDKPFTCDAASARALVDEAERSGVPLTVYQNRRWDADFRTVRELVGSGTLGEVTGFESRMEQYPPPGGFSATGGGVLRDFGSHVADQALHPAQPGSWSSFYSAFARAVRGEGALSVDPRDAVAALEVLDAARRSAARGEVVRLSRAA